MLSRYTADTTNATALLLFAVLLFACGPGGPNDHVQAPTITQGTSPQKEGIGLGQSSSVVTSSPASLATTAVQFEQSSAPVENLAVPKWMAQALASPDVPVRLQALDRWAQQETQETLDPLVVALDDENEEVREKVMAIIEQQCAIEPKIGEADGG